MRNEEHKSWKREVAAVLLLALIPAYLLGGTALIAVIVWPVFGFATAAFGLDSIAKQVL